jgi:hypothetical protein
MAKLAANRDKTRLIGSGQKLLLGGNNNNCCCFLALIIWNHNAAIDDNFNVTWNSNNIGDIDNNQNKCTGQIWSEDTNMNDSNLSLACAGTLAFQATKFFDRNWLAPKNPAGYSSNTLTLTVIQENHNGNLGSIVFGYFAKHGSTYVHMRTVYVNGYLGASSYTIQL